MANGEGLRVKRLRAAMRMAQLWRDQGKERQARDLHAPVLARFTEGLDTRDPIEAKALLGTPARPRQSKER